jgi:2,4-dienoyl-CoA reductase-like NADH-dependent reductase (Old Yellow Enzyme family)
MIGKTVQGPCPNKLVALGCRQGESGEARDVCTMTSQGAATAAMGGGGPSQFQTLFSPIRIGGAVSRNRVMRVATTSNLAEKNRVGDRMLAFYRAAAQGGAGVVVSEAARVHPADAVTPAAIPLFDRGPIQGLRRLSEAVHDAGALFLFQLNHGGRQHLGRRVGTLLAPSDIACPRSGGVPHALTTREVEQMVEFFVTAAVHAMETGADGVEVHGAQGHLIGQFVSPYTNRRDDRYGGSLENRLRFPTEILAGVRRRIGHRAIVGYRMAVEEFTEGGIDAAQAAEIAVVLARAGLCDYISLSQGNFNTIDTHLPDRHWPQATYRGIQADVKRAVGDGMVVVQSTRVQTPEQAESILAAGDGDMVGLCRALIVDPEWPAKAQAGRADEIRRCIACNQCWDWISSAEPIGCSTNPMAGREHHFGRLRPAVQPGKVLVVGGGPAGMEAARVAAERGHRVILFERERELGGRFLAASHFPTGGELRHLTMFQEGALRRAGIELRLGVEATLPLLLAEAPHAVILATGADHVVPEIATDGSVPAIAASSVGDLARLRGAAERRVVLMDEDGYYWAAAVAEAAAAQLSSAGGSLVVATRFFEAFRELPMVSRIATLRELDRAGTEYRTSMAPARIERGGVVLRHYLTGREERIDGASALLWIGAARARNALFAGLKAAGIERTHLIGDAFAPRRVAPALVEAETVARSV